MEQIDIKRMSKTERLQMMEALWNSLLHDQIEIESPAWHLDIIEERKTMIENGQSEFISLDDMRRRDD